MQPQIVFFGATAILACIALIVGAIACRKAIASGIKPPNWAAQASAFGLAVVLGSSMGLFSAALVLPVSHYLIAGIVWFVVAAGSVWVLLNKVLQ